MIDHRPHQTALHLVAAIAAQDERHIDSIVSNPSVDLEAVARSLAGLSYALLTEMVGPDEVPRWIESSLAGLDGAIEQAEVNIRAGRN